MCVGCAIDWAKGAATTTGSAARVGTPSRGPDGLGPTNHQLFRQEKNNHQLRLRCVLRLGPKQRCSLDGKRARERQRDRQNACTSACHCCSGGNTLPTPPLCFGLVRKAGHRPPSELCFALLVDFVSILVLKYFTRTIYEIFKK